MRGVIIAFVLATASYAQTPRDLYPIVVGADATPNSANTGLLGFIDGTGKVVIPPAFKAFCGIPERLPQFSEGLARVWGEGGLGYIDQTGRFAIAPQYWETGDFHDGIASVAATPVSPGSNAAAAWIDRTGKVLFKREYHLEMGNPLQGPPSARSDFSEGMLRLREGDLWGFVDTTFKWVIPPKYPTVGDFHDGLAEVQLAGLKEAFIDKTGREVVPLTGMQAGSSFSGGLALVTFPLGEGYAAAGRSGESAIFDRNGKQLTPFKFELNPALGFNGGLVPATPPGLPVTWGYINASGVWIIPPQFADASSFSGRLARVTLKTGDFGYVNRRGKVVWSGGRMTPCIPH